MSYYRTINGQRYDAALLDSIQALTEGQGDGRISYEDAQRLLAYAQDGQGITDTERATIAYARDQYNWTDKAEAYLQEQLEQLPQTPVWVDTTRFGQTARDQYERLRKAYWKARFEGDESDLWEQYALDRSEEAVAKLPESIQEAIWFYQESVEQADWGSVRLYQMPIADHLPPHCAFVAVETSTDGDDGWVELYMPTGEALGFGRTYLELIYWGEKVPNRRYVRNGGFPKQADRRQQRTLFNQLS